MLIQTKIGMLVPKLMSDVVFFFPPPRTPSAKLVANWRDAAPCLSNHNWDVAVRSACGAQLVATIKMWSSGFCRSLVIMGGICPLGVFYLMLIKKKIYIYISKLVPIQSFLQCAYASRPLWTAATWHPTARTTDLCRFSRLNVWERSMMSCFFCLFLPSFCLRPLGWHPVAFCSVEVRNDLLIKWCALRDRNDDFARARPGSRVSIKMPMLLLVSAIAGHGPQQRLNQGN